MKRTILNIAAFHIALSLIFGSFVVYASAAEYSLVPIEKDEIPSATLESLPAIVSIVETKSVQKMQRIYGEPSVRRIGDMISFIMPVSERIVTVPQVSVGTGFVGTTDGQIVTAKHVVDDPHASYTVIFPDGTRKQADVIYKDPHHDIAIVKVNGEYEETVQFGKSLELETGKNVTAIGTAFGKYEQTISRGKIMGFNKTLYAEDERRIKRLSGLIETSAPIVQGYSGGPVFDEDGKVVGVSVATDLASGLGYMVPIDVVKEILGS